MDVLFSKIHVTTDAFPFLGQHSDVDMFAGDTWGLL